MGLDFEGAGCVSSSRKKFVADGCERIGPARTGCGGGWSTALSEHQRTAGSLRDVEVLDAEVADVAKTGFGLVCKDRSV